MRRHLPSDSFVKIAVIDTIESRIQEPRSMSDCVTKLNSYLQDLQIADNILQSLGPVGNVCSLNTALATKVVLLEGVNDTMTVPQLASWAVNTLGLTAER
eukprot:5465092-Amphidinium_carterae.1